MFASSELAVVVESILQWFQHNSIRARLLCVPHDFRVRHGYFLERRCIPTLLNSRKQFVWINVWHDQSSSIPNFRNSIVSAGQERLIILLVYL